MDIKKVKSFTIKKSKWGRNNAEERTGGYLLQRITNDKGVKSNKMCCLGFACKAFGLTNKQIFEWAMPENIPDKVAKKLPKWLVSPTYDFDVERLSQINDIETICDTQKQKEIKRIFAKYGIKVKFVK